MATEHSDEQQHPAKAIDYAVINVSYGSALAGVGLTLATFSLADVLDDFLQAVFRRLKDGVDQIEAAS